MAANAGFYGSAAAYAVGATPGYVEIDAESYTMAVDAPTPLGALALDFSPSRKVPLAHGLLYRAGVGAVTFRADGYCPICDRATTFRSTEKWLRESLVCDRCKSIPRERAMAIVLEQRFPDWRNLAIHESSPVARGFSSKLVRECHDYVSSHFFPGQPLGTIVHGFRNENLEQQTFAAETFDVVITLDVMEHVNKPAAVFSEIWRTLRPGGSYIFTTPTDKRSVQSIRRASYSATGVEHLVEPPIYHGNPIEPGGSLVTFDYGYDLPELIDGWTSFDTTVLRFHDRRHGIIGEATEIYVCEKRGPPTHSDA